MLIERNLRVEKEDVGETRIGGSNPGRGTQPLGVTGVTPILLHPPQPQHDILGFCIPQTLHVQDDEDWSRDITQTMHTPTFEKKKKNNQDSHQHH